MTDPERIDALLDLVDPQRFANPDATSRLVVLGLVERGRKDAHPTAAGWNLLGERGRPYQN